MVNVCLQCGDVGFSVALINCHGCDQHLIHRYCLHPFPGFDDIVLWFCEDCQPKFIRLSKSDKYPIVVKGSDYAILEQVPVKKRKRRVKRRLWSKGSKRKSQKKEKAASPSTKVEVQTVDVEPLILKDESRTPVENLQIDSASNGVGEPSKQKKRVKKGKQKQQKKLLKEDAMVEVASPSTKVEVQTVDSKPLIQKDDSRPPVENLPIDSAFHGVGETSKRKKKRVKKAKQKQQKVLIEDAMVEEASPSSKVEVQMVDAEPLIQKDESRTPVENLPIDSAFHGVREPSEREKKRVQKAKQKQQKKILKEDAMVEAASPSTKVEVQTVDVEPLIQKDESRTPVENLPIDSAFHGVGEPSKRRKKRAIKAKEKQQKKILKEDALVEAPLCDIAPLEVSCSTVREQDEEELVVKQAEPLPSRDPQAVLCETPLQILVGEGIETENVLKEDNQNKGDDRNNSPKIQLAVTDASAEQLHDVCALPIKDPSWRGSLSIFERVFGTSTRLVAHLSNLACPRVTEATKALPELLSTDLFPRLDIWPKGFQKCRPSGNSIALYFFHNRECDEKIFDKLVKRMMDQDLGIKSVLEDAELLIFTSKVLPVEYWMFQKKVYLWGVFRGKQPSSSAASGVTDEKSHAQNSRSPVSPLSNGSAL
ncbi:unnamed protein product [Linum tenue]|uniref:AIPP2-like SPOC-like domain-containing protein n=1 Tax=Linum tenue TaxID=586396 RepID=A0AAV0IEP4_9ROSI|nr:unnamed protein product [Linum tenue]